MKFEDGSFVRIIHTDDFFYPLIQSGCACGFFCNRTCNSYLFAIFTVYHKDGNNGTKIVWAANPENPVSINATLRLTSERGLLLLDANGTIAWSTNISGKSVAGLYLTDTCNLELWDKNDATIWQSFDHPTDTLVVGQKLMRQQQLTNEGGLFSISLTNEGFFAYINSNPPLPYFSYRPYNLKFSYVQFLNQSLAFFAVDLLSEPYELVFPSKLSSQYLRIGPDGHLRVYDMDLVEVGDILTQSIHYCGYPMACGNYGVCTNDQCSCPEPINGTSYFQQINDKLPSLGCSLVTPLSCEASKYQILLEFKNITYFPFSTDPLIINPDHRGINLESCKQACLKNCSCKAAIYNSSNLVGNCYLQSQVFSLMSVVEEKDPYFKVYIKVQSDPPPQKHQFEIILGSSIASFFVLFLFIGILIFLFWKKENAADAEEYYLDHVPGRKARYSYGDLQAITENFNKELGGGGFDTVFEGTLINGTKVAVSRFDGYGQIKKLFLAEVETIGSINHLNLVRLVGFCAKKSYRLLVYEYMSNGSLDKWLFYKNPKMLLDWQHRKKIFLDIVRGLTYLHEECKQKMVHLDIKPQNILLDENFSAKVFDFGLSKLVDHDQSQVVTNMRGTPGYMVPKWLSSVITEKVDVYSFGIVLLEILCGRRNFDHS